MNKGNRFRWVICALLLAATMVTYVDRLVLGLLKTTLQGRFQFDERQYAAMIFGFQLSYAIGFLVAGRLLDKIGTRIGFAWVIALSSLATAAHAAADLWPGLCLPFLILKGPSWMWLYGAAAGLALAQVALGLGEAGHFPAALKAVDSWFPKRERALAIGIFNSGSNLGAVAAPFFVSGAATIWGWRGAFIAAGALGLIWLAFWIPLYREKAQAARDNDRSENAKPLPWTRLFSYRQTWAFLVGKSLTDPVWWLYLFWIPDFLERRHGLSLRTVGGPIVVIYLVAQIGSIGGGYLSSVFLHRGWSVNKARKTALLICALGAVPVLGAAWVPSLWMSVALVALAAAAHQGFSSVLLAMPSDLFPSRAVGSVAGIGGMGGAVGGMVVALAVGEILQRGGGYAPIFLFAGFAYLAALLAVHLLSPTLKPIPVK